MYDSESNEIKETRGAIENFVVFGTAIPETTDRDRRAGRSDAGQFVPLWKQEARDENGKRRFHGAFTGGFSAGYFNTVGSKEGWEPTNYVSSRNSRNERKSAKPEDFMDEEDLEHLAGARKLVATEEFDILGGTEREMTARRKRQEEEDQKRGSELGLIGNSLMDMLGPPKDAVGVRLLRKMGWRPGQGIGPRVAKRLSEESEDEDSSLLNDVTFAPRDTPIENYQIKRDVYGLGYDISASVPEIAEMKRLRELARNKEKGTDKGRSSFGVFDNERSSDAFGLGAFEDEGDDEDVYNDRGTKGYNRVLYEDEGGMTRDELKAQERKRKREKEEARQYESKKSKCSDGRLPLPGFNISNQKQYIGKWHAPPTVPADFDGLHAPNEIDLKPSNITKESVFSFEERGMALGEKSIEQRSVFDYIPQHSKSKLDQAVRFFIDSGKDKSQLTDFPSVPKDVAILALRGFMPFGDNLKKQKRYRDYLENHACMLTEDGTPKTVLPIPEGLTYESAMKEMDEFAKAARIFRPISAMMSGRFTSASEVTKSIEVTSFEGGLKTEEQYRKEKKEKEKNLPQPEKKQPTQEAEAAAMKMFGALTRTVKPFYPNRLVCKRFNVPNPHPDVAQTADANVGRSHAGSKEALSKESMESMLNKRMPLKFTSSIETNIDDPLLQAVIPKPSDRGPSSESKAPTVGIDKQPESDNPLENNEEKEDGKDLDYERPSMDIFKAIFDDSDSEDDEENEKSEQGGKAMDVSLSIPKDNGNSDSEELIGPLPPPKAPTADIKIEKSKPTETLEAFRPMFKRASERKEQAAPLTNILSEEIVVQPFKPRSTVSKRRRVSVSDDDEDKGEHRSSYNKPRNRSKSPESKHRGERSSERVHKGNRSRERKHKHSRKRSRSREKKSKKSKSEKHRSHKHKKKNESEDEFEGMWVEKEPVLNYSQVDRSSGRKKEGRLRAADLW
ncbi:hypothetical protein BY458DRAFT_543001 [Sporodiniella umbellata]|nr:hypothetical protein BY458DRAFT_543001 [Sporodiniella umbellata]